MHKRNQSEQENTEMDQNINSLIAADSPKFHTRNQTNWNKKQKTQGTDYNPYKSTYSDGFNLKTDKN